MTKSVHTTFAFKDFEAVSLLTSPLSICSYLTDRASKLDYLVLDSHTKIETELYSLLSKNGFRRSGQAFYRPNCQHCQQCISARVDVNAFQLSRRYKRVLKRNADVTMTFSQSYQASAEHYHLYAAYIDARHADGDMYPPSLHTFESFLMHSVAFTQLIEMREPSGKLIAVAVTDELTDGFSSIYTFFDPNLDFHRRSLGTFCILKQIEIAKGLDMPYVYLGYWIPSVKKMSYKTDFTPIELFINNQWLRFTSTPKPDDIVNRLNKQIVHSNF